MSPSPSTRRVLLTKEAPENRFGADCAEIVGLIRRRRYTEARGRANIVYKEAKASGLDGFMGRALMYQVECRVKQGDFYDLEPFARQAVELLGTSEFRGSAPRVLRIFANGLLMQGRVDAALEALEEAVELEAGIEIKGEDDRRVLRRARLENRVWLGFCELARFDYARAKEYCAQAKQFCVDGETDPWNEGELLLLEALVTLQTNSEAAQWAFDNALRIFSSSDDPIDYDRARALDMWGRATGNATLVEQASALYRQLPNAMLLRLAEEWLTHKRRHRRFVPADVNVSDDDLLAALAATRMAPEGGAPIVVIGERTRQKMKEAFRIGKNSFDAPKLIEGETGTGKEIVARLLHAASPRANRPFVSVNCSEITESLFESEMFGHKKGAFTDAKEDKVGLIEQSSGGTLFLDEIHCLSLNNARKLLKVVQNRIVRRVGASVETKVDLNIISATNVNLNKLAKKGKFPPDLLERIGVICIKTVPLRERPEEIRVLADHLVASYAARHGWTECQLDEEAHELLSTYTWPGNIRTLRRLLERAVIDSENAPIGVSCLIHASASTPGVDFDYASPMPPPAIARSASPEFERVASELRGFLASSAPEPLSASVTLLCDKILHEVVLHARATSPSAAQAAKQCSIHENTYRYVWKRAKDSSA
jgi:DNA-binding NtrC family response regulator